MWLYVTSLLIVVLDQLAKVLVLNRLVPSETLPVIPNVLYLTFVRNTGIAFGFLKGNPTWLLLFISLSILILIILSLWIRKSSKMNQFAYGLILGGAISNYLDRIRWGSIVDYVDIRVWPVFNLADAAICVGVGLFLLMIWLRKK